MFFFPFFRRTNRIFWPASIVGWLIVVVGAIYSIWEFFDIDSRSHSVSDTLINWVFNVAINLLVLGGIAWLTIRTNSATTMP